MTECALPSPELIELCRFSVDTLCIHEGCPMWVMCRKEQNDSRGESEQPNTQ